jgi:oxygen-dependent protoporphyrinogen oxidase
VVVLVLGFRREDVAHPLDGFGVLCPSAEQRTILGTLFSSTLFPGRAPAGHVLLTTFVGGVRDPEAVHLPPEWLRARVLDELRSLLGVSGAPVFEHRVAWPRAIPQPEVGHGETVRAMESLERRNPGLVLAGSWRAGVSVGDTLASGLRAADAALAHLATLPALDRVS